MVDSLTRPSEKWFFIVALPLAIAIEWAFAASLDWTVYPRSEWVALFDLCVFMPLLYLFAFSSTLPRRTHLLRAAGVAGVGLFAAGFMVPETNQFVIGELSNIRNALLVAILAFEGWVMGKVIGAVYRKGADAQALERDFAIPQWIVKLMIMEAKFWKALWSLVRRK